MESADPREYVRGQVEGYRSIPGVAPDSTTETFAALRLDIDNWRWEGVPFFIRTGKELPVTQTEVRLGFKRSPKIGLGAEAHHPEANQLVIRLDPTTGIRRPLEARRADESPDPSTITLDMRFADEGGEGPTPVRGAPALRARRRRRALHAPGRGRGGVARDAAADRRAAAGPSVRARHLGPGGGRSPRRRLPGLARAVARRGRRGTIDEPPEPSSSASRRLGQLENGLRQAGDWYQLGPVRERAAVGHGARGLQRRRDRLGVPAARPRPLPGVSLGRGRARRLLATSSSGSASGSRSGTAATRS